VTGDVFGRALALLGRAVGSRSARLVSSSVPLKAGRIENARRSSNKDASIPHTKSRFLSRANKLSAYANFLFAHANVLFAHANFLFAYANVLFAYANFLFAYANVLFAHANFLFAYANFLFAHANVVFS
jgi:hypothetical protein